MFKTDSRKGIAAAAAAVLAFAGLTVSAPAQAAVGLNVEPNKGSTYAVPVNDRMDIRVYTDGISQDLISNLKFKVTTDGSITLKYNTATASPAGNTNATALSAGTTSNVISSVTKSAGVATVLSLAVDGATYTSASETVTVVAWLDADGDGEVDDTYASSAISVNFVDGDNITWTTEFATPALGATSIDAFVSSNDINMQALNGTIHFTFKEVATRSDAVTASYNTTAAKFKATATSASWGVNATSFSSSGSVSATAKYSYAASASYTSVVDSALTNIGSEIVRQTGATSVALINGVSASATTTNTKVSGSRITVSPTATTLKLTAAALTDSGAVGVKDQTMTFKVTEVGAAGMDAGSVLTVGSTSIKFPNTGKIEDGSFTATTDADGIATIEISLAGIKKDTSFTVAASTPGVAAVTTTVTFKEAEAASVKLTNVAIATGVTPVIVVAKSTAVDLTFAVLDTYGALISGSGYAVRVDQGAITVSNGVSAGKATVTFPGYSTAATYNLTANVTKDGALVSGLTAENITLKVSSAGVPAAVSQTSTGLGTSDAATLSLTTKDWKNADTRLGESAASSLDGGKLLTGIVTDASGNAVAGATVTLTGSDLFFNVAGLVYTTGTATVVTDAAGSYSATVYAQKTGKKTVTIASGAATKAVDLYYVAAATSSGTVLAVTTNATGDIAAPGTTIRATVKLTDKFGNPVAADDANGEAFSVTVTGPGFVSAIPTKLSKTGEATLNVLLGSKDEGSVVFTASYDGDGDGTAKAAITSTKTIVVQEVTVEANAVIGSFQGRWAVRVENAKGSTVTVKVGGKWYKYVSLNDNYTFSRKSKVGATVPVKVWVDGQLQNDQTLTIK
ncbi:hypothetical protein HRU87_00645 [Aquiluna borgnonia]|uniref:Uncharacterized protein n=1 Tax=Aquiluna borgnonia TaxID=2499157 RepID=A0A7D4TTM8_9MICO|nr:carboxypeptidase-like regulatory domain-containing protein [Aquiluna borgnonia]QKJ24755.1 hypothetical protein HRU87_00645 [Aquiluna borgnonia]